MELLKSLAKNVTSSTLALDGILKKMFVVIVEVERPSEALAQAIIQWPVTHGLPLLAWEVSAMMKHWPKLSYSDQ